MTLVTVIMIFIVILMLAGIPVGFAFGLGGFAFMLFGGLDPRFAIPGAFRSIESYTLLALPLFILAGGLMREAGISRRLVEFTMSIFGRIRGGLGIVTVVACAIFGAISGSASAAIAAIGSVMIPEMEREGYSRGYSTALVANSCILALLIPPSITMIVFCMTAQISILAGFLSTVGPGIAMTIFYCIINVILCKKMKNIKVAPKIGWGEQIKKIGDSSRKASFALFMPILILGGIYTGIFTPTEAAAMSCVYSIPVGFFIYRGLTFKSLFENIKTTMITTGVVMILLFFILMMSRILINYKVPELLTELILGVTKKRGLVLLLINIILIITGMLVDDISGNILSAAILLPIARAVGVDPVHYAAISVTNLALGNVTPPCAPMLYLAGRIGGNLPLGEYIGPASVFMIFGALPVILLVTYVPDVALFLVNLILR